MQLYVNLSHGDITYMEIVLVHVVTHPQQGILVLTGSDDQVWMAEKRLRAKLKEVVKKRISHSEP